MVQHAGLDRKTGWRVRRRLRTDAAPLADDHRLRVPNLVTPGHESLDRYYGHRRRRSAAERQHRLVRRLDAIEDCSS